MLLVIGDSAVVISNTNCVVKCEFYRDICFDPNFSDMLQFMKVMVAC